MFPSIYKKKDSNPKSIKRDPSYEYIEETNKRKLCDIFPAVAEQYYFELMEATDVINLPLFYETIFFQIRIEINEIMNKNRVKREP